MDICQPLYQNSIFCKSTTYKGNVQISIPISGRLPHILENIRGLDKQGGVGISVGKLGPSSRLPVC
jgi:hypothetical protein